MEPKQKVNGPSFKRKRDNYTRKLRRKKLINYLRSELGTCTTHGLPYVVNMDIHWFERLFWLVSFFLSLAITFALLRLQFLRYSESPVVTSVQMDYYNWNVSFPAITLCPTYKIEDEDFEEFVNETLDTTNENVDAYLRTILTVSYDMAQVLDFGSLNSTELILPNDYAVLATVMYKRFDNNSLTTSTNTAISVDSVMTEMGMCHVVNSNVAVLDNPTKWSTAKYSKSNIDLTFFEQDFFVQLINYAEVYKVFVHSPNELILSTSPSYTSKSNNHIEFGVRVWSTRISESLRSAPISIRNCRFLNEPISERYPIYTYSHCILECRIKMILKLCDCIPHIYKTINDERICSLKELPCWVAHLKEVTMLSASNKTLRNHTSPEDLPRSFKDCNCLNDCESDVFMKDRESFVKEDFNRVRVSISSFPQVMLVKDRIVDFYDIILRSGGVVNLCLGTSVISVVELLVLLTKIIFMIMAGWISYIIKLIMKIITPLKKVNKKEKHNKKL